MANTVKSTNRTIEVSAIDSDFIMEKSENVESVVLIPGAAADEVAILEVDPDGTLTIAPTKTLLQSTDGGPRVQYFGQSLRLGFIFTDSTFTAGAKVIFNIGEK